MNLGIFPAGRSLPPHLMIRKAGVCVADPTTISCWSSIPSSPHATCWTPPLAVNRDGGVSLITPDGPSSASLPQWVGNTSLEHLCSPFLTAQHIRCCQEPLLIRDKDNLNNNNNSNNEQNACNLSFCITGWKLPKNPRRFHPLGEQLYNVLSSPDKLRACVHLQVKRVV